MTDSQIIAKCQILDLIGSGSMGDVHVCRVPDGSIGALKLFSEGGERFLPESEDFVAQVRVLTSLDHRHLVRVLGGGIEAGRHWLLTDLVNGTSVHQIIAASAPLPMTTVLPIIRDMADGMKYLHAQGISHRNLLPWNVFVDRTGRTIICDHGLLREDQQGVMLRLSNLTEAVKYLAPEIVLARGAGRRADLYAFGLIFYQLLAGRLPYEGANLPDWILKITRKTPLPLDPNQVFVTEEVVSLLNRLLDKEPESRPSAFQIVEELARIAADLGVYSRSTQAQFHRVLPGARPVTIQPVTPSAVPAMERDPEQGTPGAGQLEASPGASAGGPPAEKGHDESQPEYQDSDFLAPTPHRRSRRTVIVPATPRGRSTLPVLLGLGLMLCGIVAVFGLAHSQRISGHHVELRKRRDGSFVVSCRHEQASICHVALRQNSGGTASASTGTGVHHEVTLPPLEGSGPLELTVRPHGGRPQKILVEFPDSVKPTRTYLDGKRLRFEIAVPTLMAGSLHLMGADQRSRLVEGHRSLQSRDVLVFETQIAAEAEFDVWVDLELEGGGSVELNLEPITGVARTLIGSLAGFDPQSLLPQKQEASSPSAQEPGTERSISRAVEDFRPVSQEFFSNLSEPLEMRQVLYESLLKLDLIDHVLSLKGGKPPFGASTMFSPFVMSTDVSRIVTAPGKGREIFDRATIWTCTSAPEEGILRQVRALGELVGEIHAMGLQSRPIPRSALNQGSPSGHLAFVAEIAWTSPLLAIEFVFGTEHGPRTFRVSHPGTEGARMASRRFREWLNRTTERGIDIPFVESERNKIPWRGLRLEIPAEGILEGDRSIVMRLVRLAPLEGASPPDLALIRRAWFEDSNP